MSQRTLEIERIVRQVLAEFGLASNGGAATSKQAPTCEGRSSDEPDGDRELVLSAGVVTLADVEGRLDDICRLTVPRRAVVTPSVRDELRQRDILLTFLAVSGERPAAGNDVKLMVVAVGSSFDTGLFSEMLQGEAVDITAKHGDCLIRATDELGERLSQPDTLGILATKHTAAGLCLANRRPGVRAVLGLDATTTAADIAAVGANLLVVDPGTTAPFQLKQIATQFCRGGPAVCPSVFRDRLG